jgi:hypothetical protein
MQFWRCNPAVKCKRGKWAGGELNSEDPDWLLLFRLHYALVEMQQRHPWLKEEVLR